MKEEWERKEPAGQRRCDLECIYIPTTRSGLLKGATQEIQLKKKTQGSDEILSITNLTIVLDLG